MNERWLRSVLAVKPGDRHPDLGRYVVAPRLHPDDPVLRAVNRAWTDYVPTFAEHVTGMAYADDVSAAGIGRVIRGLIEVTLFD